MDRVTTRTCTTGTTSSNNEGKHVYVALIIILVDRLIGNITIELQSKMQTKTT